MSLLLLRDVGHISLFLNHPTLLQSIVDTSGYPLILPETQARLISIFSYLIASEANFLSNHEISPSYPDGLSEYLVDKLFLVLLYIRAQDFALLFKKALGALSYYLRVRDRERRVEGLLEGGIIRFVFSHFDQIKSLSLPLKSAMMAFVLSLSQI